MNYILIFFIIQLLYFFGTWKIYKKSGRKYWEAIIPIYNIYIALKITNRPKYWIIFFFIPVISNIFYLILLIDFLFLFNKGKIKDIILLIFTLGFYIYYINYSDKIKFKYTENYKKKNFFSILLTIAFVSFIHIYIIQPFIIPTSSMERTLLVGDFIFVSKFHYGLRIPITPISLPFFHNKIPIIGIPSYINFIKLPYIRLPSFKKIKRNDIVVFNLPINYSNKIIPIDKKEHYIKRCIGIPGDTIRIKYGNIYVNKILESLPKNSIKQYSYILKIKKYPINEDFFKNKLDIHDIFLIKYNKNKIYNNIYTYQIMISNKQYEILKKLKNVLLLKKYIFPKKIIESDIFPKKYLWNRDFYGPIYIPKKGDIIKLSKNNINKYYDIITYYEGHTIRKNKKNYFIDNNLKNKYIIEKNYYFMIGDNRHNSLDSRYWGFLPEDHIVGKPIFTWLSINWDRNNPINIFKWKIRNDRVMTLTNENKLIKKSYINYFLTILFFNFILSFLENNRKKLENNRKKLN